MTRSILVTLLFVAACMPARYREAPRPEPEAAAAEAAMGEGVAVEGATVVGHVTPEGTLVADTLKEARADTARVERETVVTGEIRPAAELETAPPSVEDPAGETLATGWRVQVYASRSQADASATATRVQEALGDPTPVYVERDEPWFKVRVGDFADRAAAERLKGRIADIGWPDAWAVRTTIRTAP